MQRKNPAQRRYLLRFFPLMTSYVVLLFGAQHVIAAQHPTGAALTALAVLPALPLVGVIGVMGLYLAEERDEFLRNRLIVAMLGGLGVLLAVTTVWGFLGEEKVVGPFPLILTFPLWCGAFGLIQGLLSLRDRVRDGGEQ